MKTEDPTRAGIALVTPAFNLSIQLAEFFGWYVDRYKIRRKMMSLKLSEVAMRQDWFCKDLRPEGRIVEKHIPSSSRLVTTKYCWMPPLDIYPKLLWSSLDAYNINIPSIILHWTILTTPCLSLLTVHLRGRHEGHSTHEGRSNNDWTHAYNCVCDGRSRWKTRRQVKKNTVEKGGRKIGLFKSSCRLPFPWCHRGFAANPCMSPMHRHHALLLIPSWSQPNASRMQYK